MWDTTFAAGVKLLMSQVKTGMPASLASWIAGPIDFESHGLSTIAETFLTMKSLIWFCCLATSKSPETTITL